MVSEVAEQIKRIKRSLFIDTSKLLLAPSFKTIFHSHPPPPSPNPDKHKPSLIGGIIPHQRKYFRANLSLGGISEVMAAHVLHHNAENKMLSKLIQS